MSDASLDFNAVSKQSSSEPDHRAPDCTEDPGPSRNENISCEPLRLKVLCIGNPEGGLAPVERKLAYMASYEPHITTAGSLMAAALALESDRFDVVIANCNLIGGPESEGFRTICRSTRLAKSAFLILAENPSAETANAAIQAGAHGILDAKGLKPRHLEIAVHSALVCAERNVSAKFASLITGMAKL